MEYVTIIFPAIFAGLVQGVTGFGGGIVLMVFLPFIFPVAQAAGIASCAGFALCTTMIIRYRKNLDAKKITIPSAVYVALSIASIIFARNVNQELMKFILGAFLLVLAIYFIFFNDRRKFVPVGIVAFVFMAISGICDGLFGIGGPLMVIYFLTRTK